MFGQHTISNARAHFQLVHHLYCPYPLWIAHLLPKCCQNTTLLHMTVRIPPLHPISSRNTIPTAQVSTEYHIYHLCPVRIPLLPMAAKILLSCQVQLTFHLYCPCPIFRPSLQSMYQHPISTAHAQSVFHRHTPCSILTPVVPPMFKQYPSLPPMAMSQVKSDPIYVTLIPALLFNPNSTVALYIQYLRSYGAVNIIRSLI